jgi:membrane protein implicated in regulation of membrane protease activity
MKVLTIYGAVGICLLVLAAAGITVILVIDAIEAGKGATLIPLVITVPLIVISVWMLPRYLNAVLRVDIDENRLEFHTLMHRISAIREQVRVAQGRSRLMVGVRDRTGRVRMLQIVEPFFKPEDIAALKNSFPK